MCFTNNILFEHTHSLLRGAWMGSREHQEEILVFFFGFLFSGFILTYLVGVFVFVFFCVCFVWYVLYLELSILKLWVDIFLYAWKNLTEDRWILISTSAFSLCFITHHVISGKWRWKNNVRIVIKNSLDHLTESWGPSGVPRPKFENLWSKIFGINIILDS